MLGCNIRRDHLQKSYLLFPNFPVLPIIGRCFSTLGLIMSSLFEQFIQGFLYSSLSRCYLSTFLSISLDSKFLESRGYLLQIFIFAYLSAQDLTHDILNIIHTCTQIYIYILAHNINFSKTHWIVLYLESPFHQFQISLENFLHHRWIQYVPPSFISFSSPPSLAHFNASLFYSYIHGDKSLCFSEMRD